MLDSRALAGSLLLLALPGLAQHGPRAVPVPGPIRNAGVYHLATGTWTRGGNHENLGSKVLYRNDANTGYFGVHAQPADIHWTDEGRIPSTTAPEQGKADRYIVQSIEFSYCSSEVGLMQLGSFQFYQPYASCTFPLGLPVIGGFAWAAPGGVTSTACWIVTFDLEGTSFEFEMAGDGDGVFDGTSALDGFGWTLYMDDVVAGGFNGPMLNGDPNNYAYGDGTYYQSSGAPRGTGLDTVDQFYLTDPSQTYTNGCFWFGGYQGGNPFASWWLTLGGENGPDVGNKYCTANANSTGAPADLTGSGSASVTADNLTLTSAPVPDQPCIFFHAMNQVQIPFGNGFLCASGNIVRGDVIAGAGNSASYTYDDSTPKRTLDAFVGLTRNFQHWYRDPMAGGAAFNTSNGYQVVLLP